MSTEAQHDPALVEAYDAYQEAEEAWQQEYSFGHEVDLSPVELLDMNSGINNLMTQEADALSNGDANTADAIASKILETKAHLWDSVIESVNRVLEPLEEAKDDAQAALEAFPEEDVQAYEESLLT